MKKLLALVLSVLLILAMASTATAEATKGTLSILWMTHWVQASMDVMEQRAKEWGDANGYNVEMSFIAEADFEMKLVSSIESGSGPDVALFRCSLPVAYADGLLEVTDVAEKIIAERGEFYSGNKAQSVVGDIWTCIPLYTIMSCVMTRTDIFEELGLQIPKTYDDLYTACEIIYEKYPSVYPLGEAIGKSRDGNTFVQNVLWSFGSKLAGEDGTTVTFNSPETLAGLEYMVSLYNAGYIPAGATAWDDSSNNKAWQAGQLAITSNAPSVYYNMKKSEDPLADLTKHSGWPEGPAGASALVDNYGLCVLGYTPHPEACKDLILYLTSDEVIREFYTAGGGFQFPVNPSLLDCEVFSNPAIEEAVALLDTAHAPGWPGPLTQAAAEVDAQYIMVDMFARVAADGLSCQAALDEATARIEQIYAKYFG